MIENQTLAQRWYADYVNREFDPEDIPIDDRIIDDANKPADMHSQVLRNRVLRYFEDLMTKREF